MKPIDPGSKYGELIVYGANQSQYEPLPSRRVPGDQTGTVTTRWQLTGEERSAIAAGGDVVLQQLTFGNRLQPVSLSIAGVETAPVPQAAEEAQG